MAHPWMQQARHSSDMRMLTRMRRSVITESAPSTSLNRSSHHYLSSQSITTSTAWGAIAEETGTSTGSGPLSVDTNMQTKRENATMKAAKYRSRTQLRNESLAQYSGNPVVMSLTTDRHLGQWMPRDRQYYSDDEESTSQERSCVMT